MKKCYIRKFNGVYEVRQYGKFAPIGMSSTLVRAMTQAADKVSEEDYKVCQHCDGDGCRLCENSGYHIEQ